MRRIREYGTVLAGLMALAVALSGCIKMDMDMSVSKDEKINGSVVLALSKQLLDLSGQTKAEVVKSMQKDWPKLPRGSKPEVYDSDGFIGQKVSFKDLPASDFGKVMQSVGSSNPTGGGDDITLVKENGSWKFTGTMDLSADLTGGAGGTDKKSKDNASALLKGLKIKIKMTFPGSITKHDKDGKVSGKSITWEPKAPQKVVMLAIAKTS